MGCGFLRLCCCVDGWVSEWIWSALGEDTEDETTKKVKPEKVVSSFSSSERFTN